MSIGVLLLIFIMVAIKEIVVFYRTLLALIGDGSAGKFHLCVCTLNILINSFQLRLELFFGGKNLFEPFFLFKALLFEIGKLLETLLVVLRLSSLSFELYLSNLIVFVRYFLQYLLVLADSILEYGSFVFFFAVAMYAHQDIEVVVRRYLNLLERAVVPLEVLEIAPLLHHHGLPNVHVIVIENFRFDWDSKFGEAVQGVAPMVFSDLEAIALGRGLVNEHGSSVESHIVRSNHDLVSKAQLE